MFERKLITPMFCRVMIQGKMLGRLLSLLVDEDNHRVSQKAVSPIPGLVAGAKRGRAAVPQGRRGAGRAAFTELTQ